MGFKAAAEGIINKADILSLTAITCLIFWGFLFFTQVSAAALATDSVIQLTAVWEQHKELIFMVFAAYGIIRNGNGNTPPTE